MAEEYDGTFEDGHELREVMEEAALDGVIPFANIDWQHPRDKTYQQWEERASKQHPDQKLILRNKRCTQCDKEIPVVVVALKNEMPVDSWGGVLFSDGIVCDACSPI